MKVKYELEGMSCDGCVRNVKQNLLKHPDITDAEVNLDPPFAIITMNKAISIAELQLQLDKAGNYKIKQYSIN